MAGADYPDPRTSPEALVALCVRNLRREMGLNGTDFGRIMGVVVGTVSKIEHGKLPLRPEWAARLDEAGKTGGVLTALLLLEDRRTDGSWDKEHLRYENESHTLKFWEPSFVPGLFQTRDYAREVFASAGRTEIEHLVERRAARQERITRSEDPPRVFALIDEDVLDRPGGGVETMRAQLALLTELSELPNVSVRILRRGPRLHPGLEGSFQLMIATGRTVAYNEAAFGWRTVTDPLAVESFTLRYDQLGELAIPADDSTALIRHKMERMT